MAHKVRLRQDTQQKRVLAPTRLLARFELTPYAQSLDGRVDRRYLIDRQGKQFVLYAGLLDLAHRSGLQDIRTTLIQAPAEPNGMIAIVTAEASDRTEQSEHLEVAESAVTALYRSHRSAHTLHQK
jgi:hypothetical protein